MEERRLINGDFQGQAFRDIVLKFASHQESNIIKSFDEALKVIRNKLHNDDTLVERSVLQIETIVEMLEVCLRTEYFQVDDKSFQQKDDMPLAQVITAISPIERIFFCRAKRV